MKNTPSDASIEFLIIEVSEDSTPWQLPLAFDHVMTDTDREEKNNNNWAMI